jgi:hypothetical protein
MAYPTNTHSLSNRTAATVPPACVATPQRLPAAWAAS